MREALATFLASKMPQADDISVGAVTRHTEGFSLQTFSFDVSWREGSSAHQRRLVVRREPPAGLLEPYDLEPQFLALQAIADSPVRFPRVLWYEADPAVLSAPFYVMEWVAGEVPIPALDAHGRPPFPDEQQRLSVGRDFCRILADIHNVDARAADLEFLDMPRDARQAAQRAVDVWEGYTERARLGPMPMMTEALCWLRNNLPPEGDVCLVHGDYRTGNFIVRDDRIAAFLDWEMVHLGDPMEDLAWAMSKIWRGESPRAGYLLDPNDFTAWYQEAGGAKVDQDRLHFYEVLSGVKMASIMLTGVKAWHDGRTRDMRMAIFDQQVPGMYAAIAGSLGLIQL